MGESPEQKYSRIQRDIQTAILNSYPNPERKGCPGSRVVEDYAKNPDQITAEDDVNPKSNWYHVTHCSPCYSEFLESRTAFRRLSIQKLITRRAAIAAPLALVAGGFGWVVIRRQPRDVEIDLENRMSTRGIDETSPRTPITIPTGSLKLTVRLPNGSADGMYNVQLSQEPGGTPIFAVTAKASGERPYRRLAFSISIDATPGTYTLAVRNDHREVWRYYPILLVPR